MIYSLKYLQQNSYAFYPTRSFPCILHDPLSIFHIPPTSFYFFHHPNYIFGTISCKNQYKFYCSLERKTVVNVCLTVFFSSMIRIKNANLNELELIRDFSRICCSEEHETEKLFVSQLLSGCKSLSYIHTLYPLNSILLLYCTFLYLFLWSLSYSPSL